MLGGHRVVGARGDRDLVVTRAVDDDQRDARRDTHESCDARDVDPLGAQLVERVGAEVVVADRTDERHRGARARSRHGLVGALAAAGALQPPACDRLPRPWQAVGVDDDVGVDGADHEDALRHASRLPHG